MSRRAASGGRWFPPPEFYKTELCLRCGVCCGSTDGHPCENLRRLDDGSWFCDIYNDRFGPHRTTDGLPFICVRIQAIIQLEGGYADCGYVREIKRIREEMGQDASDLGRMKYPGA